MGCMNCPAETVVAKGRCNACYLYHKRHGKDRPGTLRKLNTKRICTNCMQAKVRHKDLCVACHQYRLTTGKDRPRKLYQRREFCKVCGIPRSQVDDLSKGRCPPCAAYWRRTGTSRPRKLWMSQTGYCECGNPAVHIEILVATERYDLCTICYDNL